MVFQVMLSGIRGTFWLQGFRSGDINVTFLPLTSVLAAKPPDLSPCSDL